MVSILIVDDDLFVRTTLRDLLAERGFEVLEAKDGDEALRELERAKPDLMLLDLLMPVRSGLDVLAQAPAVSPATRVLIISSMESETLVASALQAGARGFVGKPFHPLEILSAIDQALR